MAYTIYKTNGQLLLTLLDGTLDSSRGINLVGKNYINFGTAQNENFVKLLENFANDSAPDYPMVGQIWYDTSTSSLKYFDGTSFNSIANVGLVTSSVSDVNSALVSNVASIRVDLTSNVASLTANAASQNTQISNLWSNAAIQAGLLNSLANIVTGSNVDISSMLDGVNSRVDSTDANVASTNANVNLVRSDILSINNTINGINSINSAQTVTLNVHGSNIASLQNSLAITNSSITTANVGMKSYVDALHQQQLGQINNLTSSVNVTQASLAGFYSWANINFGTSNYSNADVTLFLPTYTGNIRASNVIVTNGLLWANGTPFVSSSYGNANVAAYVAENPLGEFYSDANVAAYLTSNPQAGTYSNANVSSYLAATTVDVAGIEVAGNVVATGAVFSNGNVAMVSNVARYTWVSNVAPSSAQGSVGDIWYQTY